jgi:hypothetical protein
VLEIEIQIAGRQPIFHIRNVIGSYSSRGIFLWEERRINKQGSVLVPFIMQMIGKAISVIWR